MECQTWYICTVCKSFARSSYKPLLGHMGSHRSETNLLLRCGINSCPEEYTIYESFQSHVYRKHREVLCPKTSNSDDNPNEDNYTEAETEDESQEEVNRGDKDESEIDIKKSAALFLLKTHKESKVTQTA